MNFVYRIVILIFSIIIFHGCSLMKMRIPDGLSKKAERIDIVHQNGVMIYKNDFFTGDYPEFIMTHSKSQNTGSFFSQEIVMKAKSPYTFTVKRKSSGFETKVNCKYIYVYKEDSGFKDMLTEELKCGFKEKNGQEWTMKLKKPEDLHYNFEGSIEFSTGRITIKQNRNVEESVFPQDSGFNFLDHTEKILGAVDVLNSGAFIFDPDISKDILEKLATASFALYLLPKKSFL